MCKQIRSTRFEVRVIGARRANPAPCTGSIKDRALAGPQSLPAYPQIIREG